MSQSTRKGPASWAVLLVALGAIACDEEFDSRTILDGYRVIGVEASPPEATPDDSVLLTARDFNDGSEAIAYDWSLCIGAAVPEGEYACEPAEAEVALGSEPSVLLDMSPEGLGVRGLLGAMGTTVDADGSPRDLNQGFDVFVHLRSGPTCSKCEPIHTVKRLRLRDGNPTPNANPVIESFDVVGNVRRGEDVTLRVNVEAPERFTDPESGAEVREEYLYTWYTNSGETDPALTFDDERETILHLEDELDVTVMVAVRDGRGGLAVASLQLEP